MPQTFSASSVIMPPSDKSSGGGLSSLLNSVSGGNIILGGSGKSSQTAIFEEIINSRTLNEKVVSKLRLDTLSLFKDFPKRDLVSTINKSTETDTDLKGFLSVETSINTEYLPDSLEKKKAAELSALIANTSVDVLDEMLISKNNSSAKKSREYIDTQIARYEKQLDSVAYAMQKFQTENKVLALDKQTEAIVAQAIELSTEIVKMETELALTKIEYSENSKKVKVLKEQLKELKKQSKKIQEGGITENSFSVPLNQVPRLGRIFAELYRDREVLEQILLFLETQRHEEAIQENKDTPIVEVLDNAIVPEKKSYPSRFKMAVAGGTLSLILSFIVLFVRIYYGEAKNS